MSDQTQPTTEPTPAEVAHSLEQGLGIGARELHAQDEPAAEPDLVNGGDENADTDR
jgi:hypothetical protein